MFGIFMTVCLLSNPEECKPIVLTFAEEQPQMALCGQQAMSEMAKWIEAHPTYYVRKWSCRPVEKKEQDI